MTDFRDMVLNSNNKKYKCDNDKKDENKYICCDQVMIITNGQYLCITCNKTQIFEKTTTLTTDSQSYVKIKNNNHNSYYNMSNNNHVNQQKSIHNLLFKLQDEYQGTKFSPYVLDKACAIYNQIQQINTGDKLYIKRNNLKAEILGFIIYNLCIEEGSDRKSKDIAAFMKLTTGGFSRGATEIRKLILSGNLDMVIKPESLNGYTERYLETLNYNHPGIINYNDFVIKIVKRAEEQRINGNSLISSQIIGVIWYIIVKTRVKITIKELENAADKTKKNTFIRFYEIIINNKEVFEDILVEANLQ